MTINSLANFGVPGADGSRGATLQPVLSNRFRVLFYNFGVNGERAPYDLTRHCKSIQLPKVTFEEIKMYTYSQPTYIVNRGEWEKVEVKFHMDIGNTVMRRIENQFSKQQNFFDQTFSRAGENYKFEMDLDILAGGATAGNASVDPNILQKWSFAGCMLVDRDYGEMNVEEQKALEISVGVRFDNVISFDQNGARMGNYSHAAEIASQTGILTTAGSAGGINLSINGASVSLGGGFSLSF